MKKIISLLFLIVLLLFNTMKTNTIEENKEDNVKFILHQNNDMILSKQYDFNILLNNQKISIIKRFDENIFADCYNKYIIAINNKKCAITSHNFIQIMFNSNHNPLNCLLQHVFARSDRKKKTKTYHIRGPCKIFNSS